MRRGGSVGLFDRGQASFFRQLPKNRKASDSVRITLNPRETCSDGSWQQNTVAAAFRVHP